ncbi:MAG: ribulose-phosphate 3-epimerase [Chlamydiales bacterium]|nr:ribulose-phosphate 3-epimerase [Chlamydiales bacterium]
MKREDIVIAPSIFAGDFGRLAEEAKWCEEAGADCVHVDIMDGHFVPNLTLGPKALAAINRATELFLDVHIMIYNPFEFIERLVESGANRITFHFEATEEVEEILKYIRKANVEAGLALCPETSPEFVLRYLEHCDLILMMTVPPGFGGQKFREDVLDKVRFLRNEIDKRGLKGKDNKVFPIQVDGGVDAQTAPRCVEAGANVLVSGTYLFEHESMAQGIETLRGSCG